MAIQKDDKTRIFIVLIAGLFLLTWVLINADMFEQGAFIYIVMGVLSLFMYGQWGKFGKTGDLEGIDDNFIKDFVVGILFGIVTIFLGQFIGIIGAIGIPPVTSVASTVGKFIIIVPSAAIFEECFFRDFLHDLLQSKMKLNKFIAMIITAIGFSLFHMAAYGPSLEAAGGSFLSAGIMGLIFGLVTEWQNSLAGSIGYHATLNTYLGFIKPGGLVVIG